MTPLQSKPELAASGRRARSVSAVAMLIASLFSPQIFAQAPAAASTVAGASYSAEQLDSLVGRIALYPDDLVSIILPASTNPLQLVQADRFLDKRKTDPKLALDANWDDAVKSLLNYPEVVKTMSNDLDWTSALGEAVVADQGEVLEAIQAFRRKVHASGNLKSDGKQVVVVEKEVIQIVPADPQVIYVPQYNPATVVVYGGYSSWGYYPAPYPSYYYPYAPGAALAAGVIWGAAIGAAWNGGHYVSHYGGGNNNININRNTNINTGNINAGNINRGGASGQGGASQWKSNKQPGQVNSSIGKSSSSARVGDRSAAGAGGAGAASNRSGAGAGATSNMARPTTQQRSSSGGGAFDSYGSGRQASMDSSRGASSRSGSFGGSGGGSARMPSGGGGARMPSGGGGRRR
ncbi:MAG TPA: DUF3300 domain-containing protein [Rhodoferax sp.]|nr:DUF3300 domain-containing protein [Rhodoferax sp.]